MPRLACCWPLAYDGASRTVVHTCEERREDPLTPAETAEYVGHPSHLPPADAIPHGTYRLPRWTRRNERWFVGMDDKAVD